MSETEQPFRDFKIFDPRLRSVIAAVIGLGVYWGFHGVTSAPTRIIAGWDGFAVTLLTLIWAGIYISGIDHIRYRAQSQDLSRFLVFIFTVASACLSVFAVVALLSAAKQSNHVGLHAALSVVAVAGSWTLVHTMFALRYAHAYYGEGEKDGSHAGGLDFPGDESPNYYDFAYFSFVIGMTAQVSDVQISAKELRATALVHGILSFCFNTVILALTINTISGLL